MTTNIFQWLRGKALGNRTHLNPFETRVVDSVADSLPHAMREKLQARLEAINLVQRIDGGREVNTFQMSKGKATLDANHRLIHEHGERKLATFKVTGDAASSNSGSIWLVEGIFFSIEFMQPTEHATAEGISKVDVQLELRP